MRKQQCQAFVADAAVDDLKLNDQVLCDGQSIRRGDSDELEHEITHAFCDCVSQSHAGLMELKLSFDVDRFVLLGCLGPQRDLKVLQPQRERTFRIHFVSQQRRDQLQPLPAKLGCELLMIEHCCRVNSQHGGTGISFEPNHQLDVPEVDRRLGRHWSPHHDRCVVDFSSQDRQFDNAAGRHGILRRSVARVQLLRINEHIDFGILEAEDTKFRT